MKKQNIDKDGKTASITPEISEYFRALGKKGGAAGGHKRAKNLSRRRRVEISLLGVAARLAKKKKAERNQMNQTKPQTKPQTKKKAGK